MKTKLFLALICVILTTVGVIAQDDDIEASVVSYYQSYAFNVPALDDWENQSTDDIAQFYHADAQATIRTSVVGNNDAIVGARQDLSAFLGDDIDEPIYSDKVNLADGTWSVLVYQIDDDTTASVMSRQDEGRTYVISFIESNPDVDIVMTTIAQDTEQSDPSPEIATAVEMFTSASADDLSEAQAIALLSGEWMMQTSADVTAIGFVFGNDSYIALAQGDINNLPELANAYNTTLLGFFITPDNSGYLALGLTVALGTLAILLFSIIWRSRNLQKDLAVIQQLAEDD